MSDGMTDNSRRDRIVQRKMEKLDKKLGPGPNFGGLITNPLPRRMRELEKRMSKIEDTLSHTNCCKLNEDIDTTKNYNSWKEIHEIFLHIGDTLTSIGTKGNMGQEWYAMLDKLIDRGIEISYTEKILSKQK